MAKNIPTSVAHTTARSVLYRWTQEEDRLLLQAMATHGENWRKVAEVVGSRNAGKCRQRWNKVLHPDIVKGRWTKEEDALLAFVVGNREGWQKVSEELPGRTPKQCRDRWNNYVNPDINQKSFTPEEDQILLQGYKQLGAKWAQLSRLLQNRSENAVRLRYNSIKNQLAKDARKAML